MVPEFIFGMIVGMVILQRQFYIYTSSVPNCWYFLRPKLLVQFRKSKSLRKNHLMHCLLVKKIQVSKTTLISLNYSERVVLAF